jgi:hypothetical protein
MIHSPAFTLLNQASNASAHASTLAIASTRGDDALLVAYSAIVVVDVVGAGVGGAMHIGHAT